MWIFKKIDCGLKMVPLVQPEVWIPGVQQRAGHPSSTGTATSALTPSSIADCATFLLRIAPILLLALASLYLLP